MPATAHGLKDGSSSPDEARRIWAQNPDYNIGIVCGAPSGGLLVFDLDVSDEKNGIETLKTWEHVNGELPETAVAITGGGGRHYFYRTNRTDIRPSVNPGIGVDVRCDGSYIVAPPSVHPNGYEYEWWADPDDVGIATADANVYDLLKHVKPIRKRDADGVRRHGYEVPEQVRKGERNNELASYVGKLQSMGASDELIDLYAAEFNATLMDDPLDADEVSRTVDSVLAYKKGPTYGTPDDPLRGAEHLHRNDKDWSRLFAVWLQGRVCFVPEERGWRFWDGRHWARDGDAQRISRLCKSFVDELITYAQMVPGINDDNRQAFVKFANKYNSLGERRKLIEDTKCEVTVQRSRFDAKRSLLNLRNGTLDLDTLEFREGHDPADMLSKVAGVDYAQGATSEEWERFLDQSLMGDGETIAFLQVVMGLALTCDTSTECMFILLGPTRSGKTTAVDTVQRLLNPEEDGYACSSPPETFATKRFDDASRPSSDVARLAGRRLVVTSEPPKAMLFNVARLKQLTGRDLITARFLHENEFSFYPEFTLVMTANNAPRVNDMTLFESERVYVIPFDNHLERARQDPQLKDRLCEPANLSGILNWCIDGLRRYREEGLVPPRAVLEATNRYRAESDKYAAFIGECLEACESSYVTGKDAYTAYQTWCSDSGYQAEGKQAFYRELRDRKLMKDAATVGGVTRRNVIPSCRRVRA